MDRLVVAFANENAQLRVRRMLESSGRWPTGYYVSGANAIRAVRKLGSAVIICGFRLKDMTASELGHHLLGIANLLVLSSTANLSFCEGKNLYKLAAPAKKSDFFELLDFLQELEYKHARPCRPAEERRLIEQAKEFLMEHRGMTEAEAHRFLQKTSMDAGNRMEETARHILGL